MSQGGSSNQPRPRNQTQERERSQDAPRDGERPEDAERQEPSPADDRPEGGQEANEEGRNRRGRLQEREQGDPADPTDDGDRWGDLPPRVEEIFRNQGRDDMPVQYRDWIDAYYRRLNK